MSSSAKKHHVSMSSGNEEDLIKGAFNMSSISKVVGQWSPKEKRAMNSTTNLRRTSILPGGSALEKAQMRLKGLRPNSASNILSKSADMISTRNPATLIKSGSPLRKFTLEDNEDGASSEADDSDEELQAFLNKVDIRGPAGNKRTVKTNPTPQSRSTDAVLASTTLPTRQNAYLKQPSPVIIQVTEPTITSSEDENRSTEKASYSSSFSHRATLNQTQVEDGTASESTDSIGSDFESFMIRRVKSAQVSVADEISSHVEKSTRNEIKAQGVNSAKMDFADISSSKETLSGTKGPKTAGQPNSSAPLSTESLRQPLVVSGLEKPLDSSFQNGLSRSESVVSNAQNMSAVDSTVEKTNQPQSSNPMLVGFSTVNQASKLSGTTMSPSHPITQPSYSVPIRKDENEGFAKDQQHSHQPTNTPPDHQQSTTAIPPYPTTQKGGYPPPLHSSRPDPHPFYNDNPAARHPSHGYPNPPAAWMLPHYPISSPVYPSPGVPVPFYAWTASPFHTAPVQQSQLGHEIYSCKHHCKSCQKRERKKKKRRKSRKSNHPIKTSSCEKPVQKASSVSSIEYIPDFTGDAQTDIKEDHKDMGNLLDIDYSTFSSISSLLPHTTTALSDLPQQSYRAIDQTGANVEHIHSVAALPMYHPTLNLINDLLKTHIRLIEQFVHMTKSVGLSTSSGSRPFKYTTLKDTKEFIERHRGPLMSMEEALREIQESS